MGPEAANWDHSVDVLVVGSGGGAMTAEIRAHDLGANTLVIEKLTVWRDHGNGWWGDLDSCQPSDG